MNSDTETPYNNNKQQWDSPTKTKTIPGNFKLIINGIL
jgi:hypothetical protein